MRRVGHHGLRLFSPDRDSTQLSTTLAESADPDSAVATVIIGSKFDDTELPELELVAHFVGLEKPGGPNRLRRGRVLRVETHRSRVVTDECPVSLQGMRDDFSGGSETEAIRLLAFLRRE